jgi:hypothetical protein
MGREEICELWPHLNVMLHKLDSEPGDLEAFIESNQKTRAVGVRTTACTISTNTSTITVCTTLPITVCTTLPITVCTLQALPPFPQMYVERLLLFACAHLAPQWVLLVNNIQIREGKRTLGELDVVLRHHRSCRNGTNASNNLSNEFNGGSKETDGGGATRLLHLEVAFKLYICLERDGESVGKDGLSPDLFVGTQTSDTLVAICCS